MPKLGQQCGGFSSSLAGHAGRPGLGWGASNPYRGKAHIISSNYEVVLRRYMEALGACNYSSIKLFFCRGRHRHPALSQADAGARILRQAGRRDERQCYHPDRSFLLSGDQQHAVAYFHDDWTVNYGTLTLIYHAYPILQTTGNNYQSSRQAALGTCGGRSVGYYRCCDLPPIASMA